MRSKVNQIKQTGFNGRSLVVIAMATAGVASLAQAGDITRAPATGNLNLTTSWNGGVVPGSGDVAVWDNQSAIAGNLGTDLSFGGIRIADPTGTVSINGTNVLTLGASGIDMSAATQNLTLQPGNTTTPATGVTLGAAQIWNVGTGRQITVGNGASAITGAADATLTKSGAGTILFNSVNSSFAGGIVLNAGAITFNSVSAVNTAGVITNGPLGVGTLTINGGTVSVSTTSGRDIANDVVVNSDFTIGLAGTARVRAAGNWDLGGATRNITLTNVGTGINNNSEQFGFLAQTATGGTPKTFSLANGTMRFVAGAAATSATPSLVSFATGSGGVNFTNNSGVTIAANVLAFEGSSQTKGGTNSPKLTIEAGGVLYMGTATAPKSFTANSLSGAGLIATGTADLGATPVATLGTLTIDGSTGTSTFSGTIQDNYAIFGLTPSGSQTAVTKSGASTQVFSGTNTYTGKTTVSAGTLVMGTTSAIAPASAVTIGGGSGPAVYKLGFGPSGGVATMPLPTISSNGALDVGTGQALLTGTTVAAVQTLVNAGLASNTPAIITSSADAAHNVGYGDIGAGGVTVRYTLLGDADLNGAVNFNDFLVLQNNFSQAGVFSQGDFNYDGLVNFNDFLALQNNFGQSVTGAAVSFTKGEVAAMTAFAASVPEPTSLALLGLGAAGLIRRRRSVA